MGNESKRKTSKPIKYSILFILIHWVVLYPIGMAIDGHPPIPLMIFELPGIIALSCFSELFYPLQISNERIVFIENIIIITGTTITYGLLGFVIGLLLNRKAKMSERSSNNRLRN
jgi:hypothetical protein